MNNIWVCKPDGTIQRENAQEITLEAMKQELADLFALEAQDFLNIYFKESEVSIT